MAPFYVVMFHTTRNHCTRTWQYYTRAKNAKEAVSIARAKWHKIGREEHQFHLWATKPYEQDPARFYVVSERNWVYTGEDCVGQFIPVIR